MSEKEISVLEQLQELQNNAWRKPELTERTWYTPIPEFYLQKAYGDSRAKRLLVVGCGVGKEVEFCHNQGWDVTAFDLNPTTVRSASKASYPDRIGYHGDWKPRFFVGDVTELPLEDEPHFDAVLMSGVATSLIGRNLDLAIYNLSARVFDGGHIIISDYFVNLGEGNLTQKIESDESHRYLRDTLAIYQYVGGIPHAYLDDFQGILVDRPRGLKKQKALKLTSEEVCEALEDGDFERLFQHRGYTDFERILGDADLEILDWYVKTVYPPRKRKIPEHAHKNIQILSRKISY